MSVVASRSLEVKNSVAAGAGTNVADLASCEVQVSGTFSQTMVLQGSNDNTNWIDLTSITAPGLTVVSKKWGWLRMNTTVHSSGSATAAVAGRKERSKLYTMNVPSTTAAGAALAAYELDPATRSLQVVNGMSATLSLEGSMDGSTWTTDQDVSAGGQFDVTSPWNYIRINNTSAAGTPSALIVGKRVTRFASVRTLDTTVPVGTPSAPTVAQKAGGTPGTTHYGYKIVALNAAGHSAASSEGTDTLGAATLSSTDAEEISWTAVTGATSYDVYRTTGGATQGKIGNSTTTSFEDTGLTADASTAPTVRTSAGLSIYVGDIDSMKVVTQGAQSGNLDVEGSIDGTNYKKIGSSITGAGVADISTSTLLRLRLTWSSYTSGTPKGSVVGNLPLESVPS